MQDSLHFYAKFRACLWAGVTVFGGLAGATQAQDRPPIALPQAATAQPSTTPANNGLDVPGLPPAWPDQTAKTELASTMSRFGCTLTRAQSGAIVENSGFTVEEARSILKELEEDKIVTIDAKEGIIHLDPTLCPPKPR